MNQDDDELAVMLGAIGPTSHPGCYVFASIRSETELRGLTPLLLFQEGPSLTVIVEEADAESLGLTTLFRAAWITLQVHSELAAIGLTAAVSTALADASIACNVVAGVEHDHLFVPVAKGEQAMKVLQALQANARKPRSRPERVLAQSFQVVK
ncbi:MAG: ACT domain-containing protein [Chromatiales bacterium]|jgi:uncharacterized protein|nr:ACT domain-containing protein [Chromatiales bacterium]